MYNPILGKLEIQVEDLVYVLPGKHNGVCLRVLIYKPRWAKDISLVDFKKLNEAGKRLLQWNKQVRMIDPLIGAKVALQPIQPIESKDQGVELVIKADIELAKALKERQQRRGRIKRVFKENVLGKSLVAGSKLKFERAQLEQWRQNPSTDDNSVWAMKTDSLPLNNSRPAPSTDPVVVESHHYWVVAPLDAVDKSLTRKRRRVKGMEGLAKVESKGSEPSKAINGSDEEISS
ncbi:hypothetical protein PPACK8108_LOCUS24993 [Phakopsora pachyrhizi]|uniref:Uncharacterized protein n=1 Tax=Phakopsora pachyrhizi TaxID=170000 RepID=A0AAV0BR28_PHAPC|nr:hypothetical protein PPACK8108_LOCUS24993 [Phakopsora pachyrhizi]